MADEVYDAEREINFFLRNHESARKSWVCLVPDRLSHRTLTFGLKFFSDISGRYFFDLPRSSAGNAEMKVTRKRRHNELSSHNREIFYYYFDPKVQPFIKKFKEESAQVLAHTKIHNSAAHYGNLLSAIFFIHSQKRKKCLKLDSGHKED